MAALEEPGITPTPGSRTEMPPCAPKPNGSTGSRLALEFAERCHEGELTRLRPVLYPGHPHTCELAVFERTAEIAWERIWAGGLLVFAPRRRILDLGRRSQLVSRGPSVDEIVLPVYPMR